MASHQSPGQKVVVFRDDREPFVFRQSPDALVVVASKPDITNVTTPGKAAIGLREDEKTDSGRSAPSRDRSEKTPFTLRREHQAGTNILTRQFGKVGQNLSLGHAGGEVFKNVGNRDSKPANTGFPAALAGVNGDAVKQFGYHTISLRSPSRYGKTSEVLQAYAGAKSPPNPRHIQ
jgi:hypothetical protein